MNSTESAVYVGMAVITVAIGVLAYVFASALLGH